MLALGLDPEKATLFVQSDIPEVTELTWLLMTVTQMHLLEKCHAYKDKKAKGLAADAGLFTYPVLMAADILLYDSNLVPVGQDQSSISKSPATSGSGTTRSTTPSVRAAGALHRSGSRQGPRPRRREDVQELQHTIDVFEDPKKLRKKIMSIKTDSKGVEESKDPETCSVFTLYKLFASDEQQAALAAKYRAGGMGYGEAKQALYDGAMAAFGPDLNAGLNWPPTPIPCVTFCGMEPGRPAPRRLRFSTRPEPPAASAGGSRGESHWSLVLSHRLQ